MNQKFLHPNYMAYKILLLRMKKKNRQKIYQHVFTINFKQEKGTCLSKNRSTLNFKKIKYTQIIVNSNTNTQFINDIQNFISKIMFN